MITETLEPQNYLPDLQNRLAKLNHAITQLERDLQKAPDGKLSISSSNHTIQYRLIHNTKRTYISKKNTELITRLSQKEYNLHILQELKTETKAIKQLINSVSRNKQSLPHSKLHLLSQITPVTLSNQEYAAQWQAMEYSHKSFSTEAPEFFTNNNIRVRSKSEILIANLLLQNHIPFHYEYPLELEGHTFHPDFFCLNTRTRQTFYWEHLGLMDNPDYINNAIQRLSTFAKHNILPGKNLLLTMETNRIPLNIKDVNKLIKTFLI